MTVTKHSRELASTVADRRVREQKDEYRRKLETIQGAFDPPLTNAELSVGLDLDAPDSQASTIGRFVSESPRLARARPDSATRALIDAILDGELLVAVSRGVPGARRQMVVGDERDFRRLGKSWALRNVSGRALPEDLVRRLSEGADWEDGGLWNLFGAEAAAERAQRAIAGHAELPRYLAGRDVFPIGLGAMRLSTLEDRPSEDDAIALLLDAFDAGIQLIDTADVYGLGEEDVGHNEDLIRRALGAWAPPGSADRDRILVATKAGLERQGRRWRPQGRPQHLRAACEASLRHLDTAVLDLLQLHVPDPQVPLTESVGELARLREEGKIRHIGVCNVDTRQLGEALSVTPIAAVQTAASFLDTGAFARDSDGSPSLAERCHADGIALIAHSPLGGHRRAERAGREDTLLEIARERGEDVSPWQVALAWLLGMGPGIVPIPGATHAGRIATNIRAAEIRLTTEELRRLETAKRARASEQRQRIWQVAKAPDRAVLLMGSPAAGKTSRVEAYVARGYRRLNRDAVGGSIAALHREMARLAEDGERAFVLDNTYPTRDARRGALETARRFGLEALGLHLDVPLGEALMNACFRMMERHGRILSPEEIRSLSRQDPNMLPPAAIYHFFEQWQAPTRSEGFDRIEVIPFARRSSDERMHRGLLLDVDGTLRKTRSGAPYPSEPDDVEILPGRKEVLDRYAAEGWKLLGISNQSGIGKGRVAEDAVRRCFERTEELLGHQLDILYSPQAATAAGVWSRKPMPGMVVEHIVRHHLDRDRCLVVGDLDSDRDLAELCGIEFRWADEFFGVEG
ncbi:MAG: HAD-IIIA family hydrolase [Thermoanaerobaculia bacterium]|nr:HAD-IIIA family hydrolase [Thermoanaerobaculia bacterium]